MIDFCMIFLYMEHLSTPVNPSSNLHDTWIDMILWRLLPERHFQINEKQKHVTECRFSCGEDVNSACVIHCIDLCFRKHWISSDRTPTHPDIEVLRTDVNPYLNVHDKGMDMIFCGLLPERYFPVMDELIDVNARSDTTAMPLRAPLACCFF